MTISILLAALAASSPVPTFVEKPCADERIAKIARCGSVSVPENRDAPDRRTIALNIVVIPASRPAPLSPPLFDIDGGPGLPVTKNAEFYVSFGAAYRETRDIVMVDQRGTGGSNPLNCHEFSAPELNYKPLYAAETVARCRKTLESFADLGRYGTKDAVADLDDVRKSLGYEVINLFGMSYGTTVALRYMAVHPQRVQAVVLVGVAPPNAMPPQNHATAADRAIKMLFESCNMDRVCSESFRPAADLDQAKALLPSIAGAPSVEVFFEKLRSLMYLPPSARRIPYIVNRAAEGDLSPFYAATASQGPNLYSDGMFLSVICSESMALMDYESAIRAAQKTLFGDYRLRRQKEACAEWPIAKVGPDHLAPIATDAAVLLISGELDPVTPPQWADEVTANLKNAKHIIIPGSGHIFDGMTGIESCLDPLIVSFLNTPKVQAIDPECVRSMRPPPFAVR